MWKVFVFLGVIALVGCHCHGKVDIGVFGHSAIRQGVSAGHGG